MIATQTDLWNTSYETQCGKHDDYFQEHTQLMRRDYRLGGGIKVESLESIK